MGFLSEAALQQMGFKSIGRNVNISDKASVYGAGRISIGDHVRIDDFCILSSGEDGIEIGSYVHIACYCALIGKGKITMEDFSGISSRSVIYSSNDDYSGEALTNPMVPETFTNVKHGPVTLEKHVIVGVSVTILPNVRIGLGSAIGAYSLVTRDIDPHVIAVGVPARRIKARSTRILELEEKLRSQAGS